MTSRSRRLQIGLTILVVALYSAILFRNLNESERRSLLLTETPGPDHVGIWLRVAAVNLSSSELTARVNFRLEGSLAKDPVTPAVDLKLFLNDIHGAQEIDFPRGHRINSISATFSLDGNMNKYPFDDYRTSIRMIVTKEASAVRSQLPKDQTGHVTSAPSSEADSGLWVTAP